MSWVVVQACRGDGTWARAYRLYLWLAGITVAVRVLFRVLLGGGVGRDRPPRPAAGPATGVDHRDPAARARDPRGSPGRSLRRHAAGLHPAGLRGGQRAGQPQAAAQVPAARPLRDRHRPGGGGHRAAAARRQRPPGQARPGAAGERHHLAARAAAPDPRPAPGPGPGARGRLRALDGPGCRDGRPRLRSHRAVDAGGAPADRRPDAARADRAAASASTASWTPPRRAGWAGRCSSSERLRDPRAEHGGPSGRPQPLPPGHLAARGDPGRRQRTGRRCRARGGWLGPPSRSRTRGRRGADARPGRARWSRWRRCCPSWSRRRPPRWPRAGPPREAVR